MLIEVAFQSAALTISVPLNDSKPPYLHTVCLINFVKYSIRVVLENFRNRIYTELARARDRT